MITIKDLGLKLEQGESIYTAIEFALSQHKAYPDAPHKPSKDKIQTSAEARFYADALDAFEEKHAIYKQEIVAVQKYNNEVDEVIVNFIKDESGLFTIPEQYQDKVYSLAYSDGHSDGFYSVYQRLRALVEIFEG